MMQHENSPGNKQLENQPIFVPDYDLYESYFGDFREERDCENNKKYEADEYDNYGDLVLFV
jgi:hypothetical protein